MLLYFMSIITDGGVLRVGASEEVVEGEGWRQGRVASKAGIGFQEGGIPLIPRMGCPPQVIPGGFVHDLALGVVDAAGERGIVEENKQPESIIQTYSTAAYHVIQEKKRVDNVSRYETLFNAA